MAQASACALYPNPARDYTGIKGLIDNELIELRIGYLGGSLYDKYLKHKRTLALFIDTHTLRQVLCERIISGYTFHCLITSNKLKPL